MLLPNIIPYISLDFLLNSKILQLHYEKVEFKIRFGGLNDIAKVFCYYDPSFWNVQYDLYNTPSPDIINSGIMTGELLQRRQMSTDAS